MRVSKKETGPYSQLNTAGRGAKKILDGAKDLSSFFKFKVKNRHKIAEEAKT